MGQMPADSGQRERERGLPPWVPWVATLAVAVVVIVIAATVEGLKIRSSMRELEALKANLPGRETVYPGPLLASPTVVVLPETKEVTVLEVSSKYKVATDTVLWSGPGTDYATVRNLIADEAVLGLTPAIEIEGQRWQRVKTENGNQVGWCKLDELVLISSME